MGAFIDKFDFAVTSALTAAWYRILGQSSVPFAIEDFMSYVEEQVRGEGAFRGKVTVMADRGGLLWFIWEDVNMSQKDIEDPIIGRFHIWGLKGRNNVVITRSGWHKLYLARGVTEEILGLPRFSLSIR
ncbi:hypothetical protein KAR91_61720 [Candidatus Pacearchaeota archaeon]|nr:hypothetical protein [Candidatus Pacearchaeota archaeon]